ncbi:hypothetical protein PGT21_013299 [Puccinia graminis f. sp. tritici]|uniref:Uncharacterized protein n=1 Tax=Puccinia graminis f. sp. tritici TaxID=56615 RepID=A0A5B0S1Z3_PUCGR|nr:hypothetical protein PGT21_013299 [Puccinia graminis f. sp. tritici]KAA1131539.1 hypothetical protein PGTUg99_029270 [Puccinia graminis f. sp. tritici]
MKAKDLLEQNLLIILNFILNINSVTTVLKMARSEMKLICEIDRQFIHRFNRQMNTFKAQSIAGIYLPQKTKNDRRQLPTVFEPIRFKTEPKKPIADRFGTGRSNLNGAPENNCQRLSNPPIRLIRFKTELLNPPIRYKTDVTESTTSVPIVFKGLRQNRRHLIADHRRLILKAGGLEAQQDLIDDIDLF